jgi:hypothetical protein
LVSFSSVNKFFVWVYLSLACVFFSRVQVFWPFCSFSLFFLRRLISRFFRFKAWDALFFPPLNHPAEKRLVGKVVSEKIMKKYKMLTELKQSTNITWRTQAKQSKKLDQERQQECASSDGSRCQSFWAFTVDALPPVAVICVLCRSFG